MHMCILKVLDNFLSYITNITSTIKNSNAVLINNRFADINVLNVIPASVACFEFLRFVILCRKRVLIIKLVPTG